MLNPIEQFQENITRVQNLDGLHVPSGNVTTSAVDLTDLLRSQIVMIVSALDLYIHEITRVGMLEVYNGGRPQTDAFLKFQVSLDSAMQGISNTSRDRAIQFSSFSLHFREDRDSEIAPTEERLEHQMRIIGQLNGSEVEMNGLTQKYGQDIVTYLFRNQIRLLMQLDVFRHVSCGHL